MRASPRPGMPFQARLADRGGGIAALSCTSKRRSIPGWRPRHARPGGTRPVSPQITPTIVSGFARIQLPAETNHTRPSFQWNRIAPFHNARIILYTIFRDRWPSSLFDTDERTQALADAETLPHLSSWSGRVSAGRAVPSQRHDCRAVTVPNRTERACRAGNSFVVHPSCQDRNGWILQRVTSFSSKNAKTPRQRWQTELNRLV